MSKHPSFLYVQNIRSTTLRDSSEEKNRTVSEVNTQLRNYASASAAVQSHVTETETRCKSLMDLGSRHLISPPVGHLNYTLLRLSL